MQLPSQLHSAQPAEAADIGRHVSVFLGSKSDETYSEQERRDRLEVQNDAGQLQNDAGSRARVQRWAELVTAGTEASLKTLAEELQKEDSGPLRRLIFASVDCSSVHSCF